MRISLRNSGQEGNIGALNRILAALLALEALASVKGELLPRATLLTVNLAEAEANRIRVTAAADSERMKYEAAVLKSNPMLIQKIIAERLSDKLQIMMVPADGKFFFANDVLRGMDLASQSKPAERR